MLMRLVGAEKGMSRERSLSLTVEEHLMELDPVEYTPIDDMLAAAHQDAKNAAVSLIPLGPERQESVENARDIFFGRCVSGNQEDKQSAQKDTVTATEEPHEERAGSLVGELPQKDLNQFQTKNPQNFSSQYNHSSTLASPLGAVSSLTKPSAKINGGTPQPSPEVLSLRSTEGISGAESPGSESLSRNNSLKQVLFKEFAQNANGANNHADQNPPKAKPQLSKKGALATSQDNLGSLAPVRHFLEKETTVLSAAVKRFVDMTGGGRGTWIGDGNLFGLGIEQLDDGTHGNTFGGSFKIRVSSNSQPTSPKPVNNRAIELPDGYCGGRELPTHPVAGKASDFQDFIVGNADDVAFGRISWDPKVEPANYVRIQSSLIGRSTSSDSEPAESHLDGLDDAIPHLLRFFIENVWDLRPPNLMISVIGTSTDFDLKLKVRNNVLLGLIRQASETNAWIITNGIDSGVSKMVGEALQASDSKVPVIGIVPWGLVEGRQALWEYRADGKLTSHCDKMPVENFGSHEYNFEFMKPFGTLSSKLNRSHSHFILVDDGTQGRASLKGEIKVRTLFESCVCDGNTAVQEKITKVLLDENLGWQQIEVSRDPQPKKRKKNRRIPRLCICIEGGPISLHRILQRVRSSTPVLLIRGTGKTANFLSEVIEHRRAEHVERLVRANSTDSTESAESGGEVWDLDVGEHAKPAHVEEDPQKNSLLRRVMTVEEYDPHMIAEIDKYYGVKYKETDNAAPKVQEIIKSGLCLPFDADNEEDFSGAMLLCLLRREWKAGKRWRDCLQLIVSWNHVPILRRALNSLDRLDPTSRKAMEDAFHVAILEDKTPIIQTLLEYWNCTALYDMSQVDLSIPTMMRQSCSMMAINRRKASPVMTRWARLFSKCLAHCAKLGMIQAQSFVLELQHMSRLDEEISKLFTGTHLKSAEAQKAQMLAFNRGEMDQDDEVNISLEVGNSVIYRTVMGLDSTGTSSQNAEFDLFLWSVMMRRHATSKVLWARLDVPVRSALFASTFYRKWAKMPHLKPHTRTALIESANDFEQMAVDVQLIAQRTDSRMALEATERPGGLWKDLTAVDLAIHGECGQFVEKCCVEALDYRWSGDLNPYRQRFGLYPSVIICLMSFGLLAPSIMVFEDPPNAEVLRLPSQRKKIPKGAQIHREMNNYKRKPTSEKIHLVKKLQKEHHGVVLPLKDIWNGDLHLSEFNFAGWVERYRLFFHAPVVIFVMDFLAQLVQNVVFTYYLLDIQRFDGNTHAIEIFMSLMVGSNTACELVEAVIDTTSVYFSSLWNAIKSIACLSFWIGWAWYNKKDRTVTGICWGISAFCMWMRLLRLLSVHRSLGPLVITFERMERDVATFSALWIVLLLAFGVFMQGSQVNAPLDEECIPGTLAIRCWRSWWLVRTYYQAFGEPFFEEMNTQMENLITIAMWPVMNLMMVNLLIAMMNDTYVEVKDQAKLQWMVQMFHIAKEYRSPSRLNVFLLLSDIMTFCWRKDEADIRLARYEEKSDYTLHETLEDLRIKFKKYTAGELPPLVASKVESEFDSFLTQLDSASEDCKLNARARSRGSSSEGFIFLGVGEQGQEITNLQKTKPKKLARAASHKVPLKILQDLLQKQKLGVEKSMRMIGNVVTSKVPKWTKLLTWSLPNVTRVTRSINPRTWAKDFTTSFRGATNEREYQGQLLHQCSLWRFKLKRKLLRLRNRQKMDAEALRDQIAFLGKARDQYLSTFDHSPLVAHHPQHPEPLRGSVLML